MIIGIYDRLISSVSSFLKDKKRNFIFLLLFCLGAFTGMVLLAKPLLGIIEQYTLPSMYFFIGAVAGGIPLIFRQSGMRSFSFRIPLYILLGAAVVLLLSFLPSSSSSAQMEPGIESFLMLALSGFIAAVALILPGISVSYLLLLMGLYNETMRAVSTLYIPFLLPLAIGLVLGILLTTKLLENGHENSSPAHISADFGFYPGFHSHYFPGNPHRLGDPFLSAYFLRRIRSYLFSFPRRGEKTHKTGGYLDSCAGPVYKSESPGKRHLSSLSRAFLFLCRIPFSILWKTKEQKTAKGRFCPCFIR